MKTLVALCALAGFSTSGAQKLGSTDSFYNSRLCGIYKCQLEYKDGSEDYPQLIFFAYSTDSIDTKIFVGRNLINNKIGFYGVYSESGDSSSLYVFEKIVRAALPGTFFTWKNAENCLDSTAGNNGKYETVFWNVRIGCKVGETGEQLMFYLKPTSSFK